MADNRFIPKGGHNSAWLAGNEKHLLIKHYDFLEVTINGSKLKCLGKCKPSDLSIEYRYELRFAPGSMPRVYAIDPIIEYNDEIHMFPTDNSLCLYFPNDFSWTGNSHLFDTIIPWTHEWFLFYELYEICGKWLHPSVPHKTKY